MCPSKDVFQGVQRQVLDLQRSHDIKMKLMKEAVHEAESELAFVRGSQDVTDLELSRSKRSLQRFRLKKLKFNRVLNAWRMRQSREKAMQEVENDLPRARIEVDPRGLGSALRETKFC